jgi:hypothetical protein
MLCGLEPTPLRERRQKKSVDLLRRCLRRGGGMTVGTAVGGKALSRTCEAKRYAPPAVLLQQPRGQTRTLKTEGCGTQLREANHFLDGMYF